MNARYVIATSSKVDLSGIDEPTVEKVAGDGYFAREKGKKGKKGEDEFFAQGEKPEVRTMFEGQKYCADVGTAEEEVVK